VISIGKDGLYHFLVGFVTTPVTRAVLAIRHRSNNIVVIMRSNNLFRSQLKVTLISSLLCITLIDQKDSGTKFLTRLYLSTTKPSVGNWQDPNHNLLALAIIPLLLSKEYTITNNLLLQPSNPLQR
jgi:hypothetical protein